MLRFALSERACGPIGHLGLGRYLTAVEENPRMNLTCAKLAAEGLVRYVYTRLLGRARLETERPAELLRNEVFKKAAGDSRYIDGADATEKIGDGLPRPGERAEADGAEGSCQRLRHLTGDPLRPVSPGGAGDTAAAVRAGRPPATDTDGSAGTPPARKEAAATGPAGEMRRRVEAAEYPLRVNLHTLWGCSAAAATEKPL